jgi:hypothetical protein
VAVAEVVSGFLSNAASSMFKRLWSLKSTAKTGDCLPKSFPTSPILDLTGSKKNQFCSSVV